MPSPIHAIETAIFSPDELIVLRQSERAYPSDKIDNTKKPYLKVQPAVEEPPPLVSPSDYKAAPLSGKLVQMLDTITRVAAIQKGCADDVVSSLEHTIVTQQQEALRTSQSEREYTEQSDWADFFKQIAVCVLSAFALVIGGEMIFDNPDSVEHLVGGGAMIVSALASLIGNTMVNSNDSPQTAAILTLISMGFGLIGGTAYLNLSGNTLTDIASRLGMASLAIVSSVAELGKQYSHFQIEELKAAQALIEELLIRCRNIAEQQSGYESMSTKASISSMSTYSDAAMGLERAKKVILAQIIAAQSA